MKSPKPSLKPWPKRERMKHYRFISLRSSSSSSSSSCSCSCSSFLSVLLCLVSVDDCNMLVISTSVWLGLFSPSSSSSFSSSLSPTRLVPAYNRVAIHYTAQEIKFVFLNMASTIIYTFKYYFYTLSITLISLFWFLLIRRPVSHANNPNHCSYILLKGERWQNALKVVHALTRVNEWREYGLIPFLGRLH